MRKSKKVKYTDEVIGKIKILDDFLPPPDKLMFKEKSVKINLTLSKESLDFYKKEAKTRHTQYQKIIRVLLDQYAHHYQ